MHNARHLSRRAIADGQLDGVIVARCLVHRIGQVLHDVGSQRRLLLHLRHARSAACGAGSPLSSGVEPDGSLLGPAADQHQQGIHQILIALRPEDGSVLALVVAGAVGLGDAVIPVQQGAAAGKAASAGPPPAPYTFSHGRTHSPPGAYTPKPSPSISWASQTMTKASGSISCTARFTGMICVRAQAHRITCLSLPL